jgi:type IV pilus assembly protein PilQ
VDGGGTHCYHDVMRGFPAALLTLVLSSSSLAAAPPAPPVDTSVSVDFKDVDVVDVVRLFAEVGSFQVVVDPGISCKLTLKLKEVPWPTALDLALKVCSLGSETDNGIVRVAPVAKLTSESEARRKFAEEQKLNRPLRTNVYRLSYAKATELAPLLKKFLSARGDIVVDPRTNTLIITDVE